MSKVNEMNIIMVGPSKNMCGGISTVVNGYYEAGLDKLVNLEYIASYTNGSIIEKLTFFIKSLVKFIRKINKKEIVHIHTSKNGSFYRKSIYILISKLYKKKVILHIHSGAFKEFYINDCNRIVAKYVKYIVNLSDSIIVLSIEAKTKLLDLIVNENKINIIHNSIKVNSNCNNKVYSSKNIVFLGRIGQNKGVYDIINVGVNIINKFPDVKITIAGDGEKENVEKICLEKKLNSNIKVLGWTSGTIKNELLEEATLFLLPSYSEGMPMSILEAMTYKIPIISTYVGGIPEQVENNVNGILIEPGNLIQLEEAITELLENEEKRRIFGTKSFESVSRKFNIDITIRKLHDLYKKM